MAVAKWRVAVISTDYDLHDLRAAVIRHVADSGFAPIAFEHPDFPVEPHVHSHQACIDAVGQADIVILIIDKRYGGRFYGGGEYSITHEEYKAARRAGQILIPCVRKQSWDERFTMFAAADELLKGGKYRTLEDARGAIGPHHVEDWGTLDFIEAVRREGTDNFTIIFNDATDLTQHLSGWFVGLTRYVVSCLVEKQVYVVSATKTTTAMAMSLGDVLGADYFVEPPVRVVSGALVGARASETAAQLRSSDLGVLVLGGPGVGKTTLIAKAYLEQARECLAQRGKRIPFFVSLRGRGANYHFDVNEYLKEAFAALMGLDIYPALDLTKVDIVFYLDGFDEVGEDVANVDLQRIASSTMLACPFALSCRSRPARDYLDEITVGNRFVVIMELLPWDVLTALEYIRRFCERRQRPDLFETLRRATAAGEAEQVIKNPLLLTILLWIVDEAGLTLPLDPLDQYTAYDRFLMLYGKRELARAGQNGTPSARRSEGLLRSSWRVAAWEIYRSRFRGEGPLALEQLRRRVLEVLPEVSELVTQEPFLGLLDIQAFGETVMGMLHEQILEHLVAEALTEGMLNRNFPFPGSLGYVIRPEINRTVRAIWRAYDGRAKSSTLVNLWREYEARLGANDAVEIVVRDQATYYMGRLGTEEAKQKLVQAKQIETAVHVQLSIRFGLTKLCHFDEENEFLQNLKTQGEWDRANRGYHLVYYKDWPLSEAEPPYYDPGNTPWAKTMNALLRHLESTEARHVALRRIELYTLRRFVETRGRRGPLNLEILNEIREAVQGAVSCPAEAPLDFAALVGQEFEDLRAAWQAAI